MRGTVLTDGDRIDCVTVGISSLKCTFDAGATGRRGGSIVSRAVTCDWFQSWARVGVV